MLKVYYSFNISDIYREIHYCSQRSGTGHHDIGPGLFLYLSPYILVEKRHKTGLLDRLGWREELYSIVHLLEELARQCAGVYNEILS